MIKKKKVKKCSHIWEHKIKKGRSISEKDKKEYDWLVHKCKKCGIEVFPLKIF